MGHIDPCHFYHTLVPVTPCCRTLLGLGQLRGHSEESDLRLAGINIAGACLQGWSYCT
jgi:hypothetical protein